MMKAAASVICGALLLPVLFVAALVGGGTDASPAAPPIPVDESELAHAVLTHPNIELRPAARADVEAGRVDARVLVVVLTIAANHRLGLVGPFVSGHSYYVAGTDRPSNHAFGRAVDLASIDGAPITVLNSGAYAALREVLALPPSMRPDEVGAPWEIPFGTSSTFTANHHDHLHFGFESRGFESDVLSRNAAAS